MNRRKFLKILGIGCVAGTVGSILPVLNKSITSKTIVQPKQIYGKATYPLWKSKVNSKVEQLSIETMNKAYKLIEENVRQSRPDYYYVGYNSNIYKLLNGGT